MDRPAAQTVRPRREAKPVPDHGLSQVVNLPTERPPSLRVLILYGAYCPPIMPWPSDIMQPPASIMDWPSAIIVTPISIILRPLVIIVAA